MNRDDQKGWKTAGSHDNNWRSSGGRGRGRHKRGGASGNSGFSFGTADSDSNWRKRSSNKTTGSSSAQGTRMGASSANQTVASGNNAGRTTSGPRLVSLTEVQSILKTCSREEPLARLLYRLVEHRDGQLSAVKAVRVAWNSTIRESMSEVIQTYTNNSSANQTTHTSDSSEAELDSTNQVVQQESIDTPSSNQNTSPTGSNRRHVHQLPSNIRELWPLLLAELTTISPGNDHVFARALDLISSFQERYRISVAVSSDNPLNPLLHILLAAYDGCQVWIRPNLLRAMAALLLGNITLVDRAILLRLADRFELEADWTRNTDSHQVVFYAITGLANLSFYDQPDTATAGTDASPIAIATSKLRADTVASGDIFQEKKAILLPRFLKIFINMLDLQTPPDLEIITKYRIQQLCLHGINLLLTRSPKLDLDMAGRLLGILRLLIGCGLVRYPANMGPVFSLGGVTSGSDSIGGDTLLATGRNLRSVKRKEGKFRPQASKERTLEDRLFDMNLDDSEFADLLPTAPSTTPSYPTTNYLDEFSSNSDFSDSETSPRDPATNQPATPLESWSDRKERRCQSKTRRLSLSALRMLLHLFQRRILIACWPAFLPDGSGVSKPTLLTLIMKEGDSQLRHLILEIVCQLVENGEQYLNPAEDLFQATTAFTPHSARLAVAIRELHRRLLLALIAERATIVQVLLLKCLTTLVSVVPYHKLKPGLLTQLVRVTHPFLEREAFDVRTASLAVWGAVVLLDGPLLEVCHLLARPPEPLSLTSANQHSPLPGSRDFSGPQTPFLPEFQPESDNQVTGGGCWLVQLCLSLAHPGTEQAYGWAEGGSGELGEEMAARRQPAQLRLQALATMRQMKPFYMRYLKTNLSRLKRTLQLCLEKSDDECIMLRTQALKVLSAIISALTDSKNEDDQTAQLDLWREFIDPVIGCLQSESHFSVRSWACRCVARLDERTFQLALEERQRFVCLSTMISLCSDDDRHVKGNAVRTLGFWVTLSPLNQYPQVLSDVIYESERLCSDPDVTLVRCHAAWTLANCAEVLVALKEGLIPSPPPASDDEHDQGSLLREFTSRPDRLKQMFAVCRFLCSAVSKKSRGPSNSPSSIPSAQPAGSSGGSGVAKHCENGARALGHLFRFVPADLAVCEDMKEDFILSVQSLCDAMVVLDVNGAAKIRWNACFAAGNLFRNPHLPIGWEWTVPAIEHLCQALVHDKYFKVRNYACISLLVLTDTQPTPSRHLRLGSGHLMGNIVSAVFTALRDVESARVAYTELQHRTYCLYLGKMLLLKISNLLLDQPEYWPTLGRLFADYGEVVASCGGLWSHARELDRQQMGTGEGRPAAQDPMFLRAVLVHNNLEVGEAQVARVMDGLVERCGRPGDVPDCVQGLCALMQAEWAGRSYGDDLVEGFTGRALAFD